MLLLLIIVLIIGLYQLFRFIKWIVKKEIRVKWALGLAGVIMLSILVNHLFFKNMKFIQSRVYPDLYLVKYPIKDKDSLHKTIEKLVLEKVNSAFLDDKGVHKFSRKQIGESPYSIRFYEYYTGTPFFVPFGEAGTTHFIEHKEDPGGFSSEIISHYNAYRIAEFNLKYCTNDSLNYVGTINYYQGWDRIKSHIIINQCRKTVRQEQGELIRDNY